MNAPLSSSVKAGLQAIEQMIRTAQRQGNLSQLVPLVYSVGPTVCGIKAGELLTYPYRFQFSQNGCGFSPYQQWQAFKPLLALSQGIDCLELIKPNGTRHILVVHRQVLEQRLKLAEYRTFLRGCGYPQPSVLESCLRTLTKRLQSDIFPHEIGLFLGYPLEDVKGFMGYGTKPLAYIKGWQVYEPREAEKLARGLTWVRQIIELSVNKVLEKEPLL